jgi:hypothetical protein
VVNRIFRKKAVLEEKLGNDPELGHIYVFYVFYVFSNFWDVFFLQFLALRAKSSENPHKIFSKKYFIA